MIGGWLGGLFGGLVVVGAVAAVVYVKFGDQIKLYKMLRCTERRAVAGKQSSEFDDHQYN